MTTSPVPVMLPRLAPAEVVGPYLEKMHVSRVFSNNGPLVQELEARYAALLGTDPRLVVAAANATLALAGCMHVLPPDRWILPDWTFVATGHAAHLAGVQFEFRDIAADTWLVDPLKSDNGKVLGVVPVMPFGAPVQWPWAARFEFGVVDAAASLGNLSDLGSMPPGWATVFSLHATKILGCGEGAVAVFGSSAIAEKFRSWINFGFGGQRVSLGVASNAKMSEVHAAFALGALDEWEQEKMDWRNAQGVAAEATRLLNLSGVPQEGAILSPYWIVDFQTTDKAIEAQLLLNDAGIETRRWWQSPLSDMPAFTNVPCVPTPVSHRLAQRVVGLPMFRDLPSGLGEDICKVLAKVSASV